MRDDELPSGWDSGRLQRPPAPGEEHIDPEVAAIAQYTTQVPVIFRYTDDQVGSVREHACGVGDPDGPAERFWPVLGTPPVG